MPNYGLYSLDSTWRLNGRGFLQYEISRQWPRTSIAYDGVNVVTTSSESNKFGTYIIGSDLVLNGEKVADSNGNNIFTQGSSIKFGDADLLGYDKCINITLEDYNALIQGSVVDGYKAFDPKACYNIVDDVASANVVTIPDGLTDVHDPIYNNLYDPLRGTVGHTDDPYDLPDNEVTE